MKKMIAGIIIGIALTISTSVFAAPIKDFILKKVEYPLIVKGKIYANEGLPVLNYQGTTYVPLKAIGDVLGTSVKWNENLKQVEIGDVEAPLAPSPTSSPVATPSPVPTDNATKTEDKGTSRAEVISFLVKSVGLSNDQGKVTLKDVPFDNIYYKDISTAINSGIITPYADGLFRPDMTITRAEYAVILVRALDLPTLKTDYITIKDMEDYSWATQSVQAVVHAGVMTLYEDGTFGPNKPLQIETAQPNMKLKEIKDKIIAEKKSSVDNDHLLELNKAYKAKDGLTVTILSINKIEEVGSIRYSIFYKLTNESIDKKIDEGIFKLHLENGVSPQYGFFGTLFPAQSVEKNYTFEILKQEKPTVLEYGADFLSSAPEIDSLKWKVNP